MHDQANGLTFEDIERERKRIIERYGEWTDHNIRLQDDIYTISRTGTTSRKLQRILQVVSDLSRKPFKDMRVLDLACLEGLYGIEFALQGASVLAIEGREQNIEKSRFTKRALKLDNIEFVQGNVVELSPEKHGRFDVVLCLGILYHLDDPDVFSMIERIGATCDGFAVFDTYVSLAPINRYSYNGQTYRGRDIKEHNAGEEESAKRAKLWASLHNTKSVWITKATLYNMLMRSGFTSIYECDVPLELDKPLDRITVVAVKGRPATVRSSDLPSVQATQFPEVWNRLPSFHQRQFARVSKSISHMVPRPLRDMVKRRLRAKGLMKRKLLPWEWADPFKSRDRR